MSTLEPRVTLEVEQAAREIIACGVRAPGVWDKIKHVRPEWFTHWSDQVLWRAIQYAYEQNGGFEVNVVLRWLQEYCRADADALLDRLANIAEAYLHAEFVDFYLGTLERSGERLAVQRWAGHVAEMCGSGRSMSDICEVVSSPPIRSGGVA